MELTSRAGVGVHVRRQATWTGEPLLADGTLVHLALFARLAMFVMLVGEGW